jgi:hypothetical protein
MAYGSGKRGMAVLGREEADAHELDEQGAADAAFAGEDDDEREDPYTELANALKDEAANALGIDGDTIADEQVKAFERYLGRDYGDEIDGMSRVHTREVFETVEWLRPTIARVFAAGSKAIKVSAWGQGTEQLAQEATDYLNHVLFEEADGLAVIDSFAFNGLVQKIGVLAACWKDDELGPPRTYENVSIEQAQKLILDEKTGQPREDLELLETKQNPDGTVTLKVQHVVSKARPELHCLPPEDWRCSKRTVSLQRPAYCGHTYWLSRSQINALLPGHEDILDEIGDGERGWDHDERRSLRFDIDDQAETGRERSRGGEDIPLEREYYYFDLNDDGYDELLEVWRIGDKVLEVEEIDDNIYAAWSPIRIPHKLVGLSMADITSDIQRVQTVLMRASMNATMLAVAPRTVVREEDVNLTDLLTVRPGGIIRIKKGSGKEPSQAFMPMITPDVSGSALKMMDRVDMQRQSRTGITQHSQGLNPDVLNETMGGIELLQTAAEEREEMILRNLAAGLEAAVRKFWRLLVQNRKGEQSVEVQPGQWRKFNPEKYSADAQVKVDVGQGTGNTRVRLMQLQFLLQLQQAVITRLGPANPFVTPMHLHNTIEEICRLMGFRTADQFFADPTKMAPEVLAKAMQPPPDPKAQQAMQKMQADMAAMQKKFELAMAELQQKGVLKREELQQEAQLEREKMGAEVGLAREEIQADALAKATAMPVTFGRRTQLGGDKL